MEVSSKTLEEIDESTEKENLRTLEAVFFVSGRFLNMSELVSLSDLNPIIIRELIDKLKEKYESSDSAMEIVEKNGLWKMDVRQEFTGIVNKLATGSAEFTKAEQETLAIIAYKQPMKQSVIIKIRGNKAYDHIKKFTDLNLIKRKKIGHTHELSLSDDFYDYFNVVDSGKNASGGFLTPLSSEENEEEIAFCSEEETDENIGEEGVEENTEDISEENIGEER